MPLLVEPSSGHTPRSALTDHTRYVEPLTLSVLAGRIPDDLHGHVFITSPDVADGVPLFGADGMLYRFDLHAHGVSVRSGSTRTPSAICADQVAARRVRPWSHAFRQVGLARVSPALGAVECPNVAPVRVGERLWVTSDTGRPWEVDPVHLTLRGPVGGRDDWVGVAPLPWLFPLRLTSGHPVVDPDEVVWSCCYNNAPSPGRAPFLHLLRLHGGDVRRYEVVDAATGAPARVTQSAHQMVGTERHLILLDAAFKVEAAQLVTEALRSALPILPERLLAPLATQAQAAEAVVWVIDRAHLHGAGPVPARRYAIAGEATHMVADWAAPDGVPRVHILHTPCQDASEWIRAGERMVDGRRAHPDLVGFPAAVPLAHGEVGVHDLLPDGSVRSRRFRHDPFTWGPALMVAPEGPIARHRRVWFYTSGLDASVLPERIVRAYADRVDGGPFAQALREGRPCALVGVDLNAGAFDGWPCPPGWGVFGLAFAPRAGAAAPDDGYLIVCALSDPHDGLPQGSSGDELWIFDAQDVAAGPLCRLGHPELDLPFCLHSTWAGQLRTLPPAWPADLAADLDLERALQAWSDQLPGGRWLRAVARAAVRPLLRAAALDEALAATLRGFARPPGP